jgi:hypothetical protein
MERRRFLGLGSLCVLVVFFILQTILRTSAFFLGGRRGTCTPKHFVNLTGQSKNVKMLEFPLELL